jgi:type 1 glutamine amidotransferase
MMDRGVVIRRLGGHRRYSSEDATADAAAYTSRGLSRYDAVLFLSTTEPPIARRAHGLAALGAERPLAWCHRFVGGRSIYTAMGRTGASFSEPRFLSHLLGAIETAARRARLACAV